MVDKYEIRAQDLQRAIESLKRGIQTIYEKLGIDEGDGLGQPLVTELNMVHYVGLIERKANDILQNYAEARQALMGSSMAPSKFNEKQGEVATITAIHSLLLYSALTSGVFTCQVSRGSAWRWAQGAYGPGAVARQPTEAG